MKFRYSIASLSVFILILSGFFVSNVRAAPKFPFNKESAPHLTSEIVLNALNQQNTDSENGQVSDQDISRGFDELYNAIRKIIVLVLLGALTSWLWPHFLEKVQTNLKARPGASAGFGTIIFFMIPVAILAIIAIFSALVILSFYLSFNQLAGTLIVSGLTILLVFIVGLYLMLTFIAKIIMGHWLGKLIFSAFKKDRSKQPILPVLIGVIFIGVLVSVPKVGWVVSLVIDIFAFGALWLAFYRKKRSIKEEVD